MLNIKQILKEPESVEDPPEITKLAIGKAGGADITKEYDTIATLKCVACDKELDKTKDFIEPLVS